MTDDVQTRQPVRWPWVPRSWTAASLLLVSGVLVAGPTILLAFIALVTATGCFIECSDPEPGNAVVPALGVLVTVALPFAAVRFYQGAESEAAARRRLAVVAVIVLLVALVEARLLFG
jgi:hypothetical protein